MFQCFYFWSTHVSICSISACSSFLSCSPLLYVFNSNASPIPLSVQTLLIQYNSVQTLLLYLCVYIDDPSISLTVYIWPFIRSDALSDFTSVCSDAPVKKQCGSLQNLFVCSDAPPIPLCLFRSSSCTSVSFQTFLLYNCVCSNAPFVPLWL